ncbi:hypothetical protein HHK36_007590 [Tetracentron sinense]|uniref:Uncharacterized protein n=1 Tax=Tetracentron sinense TaxID=13715 RepID=A0A835DQA6_TETSI|nr:hypothetical protein HHK36_007590 [Tetracentron sinense]
MWAHTLRDERTHRPVDELSVDHTQHRVHLDPTGAHLLGFLPPTAHIREISELIEHALGLWKNQNQRSAMEEEMVSMISNARIDEIAEGSESNSSRNPFHPNKRKKHEKSALYERFKGVVLLQNGHWGAQIYANHQRIWLGTFKEEKEAAMAYDSAAIKLRSGDSSRNFPWTNLTIQEANFQDHQTSEAVLNMIKDGSYQSKFKDFLRTQSPRVESGIWLNLEMDSVNEGKFLRKQLFQKELTPSDVGKLNRLVLPKKHAIKYFPNVSESSQEDVDGGGADDVQLVFYDMGWRPWEFRYCYWKSSQSFVLTRGWNRFVQEKELKAKDMIIFYKCEPREGFEEERTFCMIDVRYNGSYDEYVGMKVELQMGLGQNTQWGLEKEKVVKKVSPPPLVEKKGLKLFGVQIS